ncbi:bifunctional UDP-sugar hydrolase/5'-nucleotidase [Myxococcaceae bacterium GXIMD 01537]
MKHLFLPPLALAALLGSGCALLPHRAEQEKTVRLTVLHLNDVYQFTPVERGRAGGLARAATLVKEARKESADTLLLFAGDTLSPSVESQVEVKGEALKGRQMMDAWNALGVDYGVLGNHEFDFGDEVLRERLRESDFPWLGTNVIDTRTGQPFEGTVGTVMREVGGIRVGLLGVLLPETKESSKVGPDTRIDDFCATAQREVPRLRAQGAQLVVALTHLDNAQDQQFARCAAVDLIIGGHDHARFEDRASGAPIFKVAADALELGRVTLDVGARTGKVHNVAWEVIPITDQVPEDETFASSLRHYDALMAELSRPVGTTEVLLDARNTATRTGETNLGSFIADTLREAAGADVALVNGGFIRADTLFTPGVLTRRDMLAILPFRDEVVVVDVSGATLRKALENGVSLSAEDARPGRFPQVSGLRFSFDASRPKGQRVLEVTVAGKPLREDAIYSLATLRFIAGGKDGYSMLKGAPTRPALKDGRPPVEVLSTAVTTESPIAPEADGRIHRLGSEERTAAAAPAEGPVGHALRSH